jgi:hypothetical protein
MIETMARVIHPGWLTRMFEDATAGTWAIYHQCTTCGYALDGQTALEYGNGPFANPFLLHKRSKHPTEIFNLEIYILRAAIHARHLYYGLRAFEWPN